jgi:hypothetical protein
MSNHEVVCSSPPFAFFSNLLKNLFPYIFVMENTYNVFLLLLHFHVLSRYRGIGTELHIQWSSFGSQAQVSFLVRVSQANMRYRVIISTYSNF